jgi:hypothetical protein
MVYTTYCGDLGGWLMLVLPTLIHFHFPIRLPSTAMPTVEQIHTSLGYGRVQNIPQKSAKINTFKAFKCSSYFKNILNDSKTFTKKKKSNTVQKMHLGKPAHLYFRFWCFKHHRNHSFNAAQIKMTDFERLKDFECLRQGS